MWVGYISRELKLLPATSTESKKLIKVLPFSSTSKSVRNVKEPINVNKHQDLKYQTWLGHQNQ